MIVDLPPPVSVKNAKHTTLADKSNHLVVLDINIDVLQHCHVCLSREAERYVFDLVLANQLLHLISSNRVHKWHMLHYLHNLGASTQHLNVRFLHAPLQLLTVIA